ncbi:unnamed protein product [Cuscuta europaea]|uniref:Uncharacterized protein n=1 Tax=Cuscuta europaea TaxID=41803 RepID=A0A9P1EQ62_CUSEU|nr:unnamed protein product [Cuscuta europaea]
MLDPRPVTPVFSSILKTWTEAPFESGARPTTDNSCGESQIAVQTTSANFSSFTWANLLRPETKNLKDKVKTGQVNYDSALDQAELIRAELIQATRDVLPNNAEKFIFYGEEGFDSIKIGSSLSPDSPSVMEELTFSKLKNSHCSGLISTLKF